MTVDDRRDHSFRVPRPDLTVAIGTPNACAACHGTQPAAWAAAKVAEWRGPSKSAAAALWRSDRGRTRGLCRCRAATARCGLRCEGAGDRARDGDLTTSPMARRSLRAGRDRRAARSSIRWSGWRPWKCCRHFRRQIAFQSCCRWRAMTFGRSIEPPAHWPVVPDQSLSAADRDRRNRALTEWEQAQQFSADAAGAHIQPGRVYAERGDVARAKILKRRAASNRSLRRRR